MSFSQVKNVRIGSLTAGALVQLRLGKAASKHKDDTIIEATFVGHRKEGDKSFAMFDETDSDGRTTELVISRLEGASWRSGKLYVALHAVDESTFTLQKAASPIRTDVINEAIALVEKEHEDVFASDQLVALLNEIATGSRINTNVKALATRLAHALVRELSSLEPKASVED